MRQGQRRRPPQPSPRPRSSPPNRQYASGRPRRSRPRRPPPRARGACPRGGQRYEQATSEGQLAAARGAQATLAPLRESVADPGRQLQARIAAADEAYAKLAHWQHWSNNKVRARLCAEIEALAGAGMHPDGVAAKVKDTQLAWQRLDESEAAGSQGRRVRYREAISRRLPPRAGADPQVLREAARTARRQARAGRRPARAKPIASCAADPRAVPALRRRLVDALQHLDEAGTARARRAGPHACARC